MSTYRFENGSVRDARGDVVARVKDRAVYDAKGNMLARLRSSEVWASSNRTLGRLAFGDIVDTGACKLARVADARREFPGVPDDITAAALWLTIVRGLR